MFLFFGNTTKCGCLRMQIVCLFLCEQWVFLPDSEQRSQLVLPPPAHVDYRAACFCHRNLIEIGYVCSVCLSSKSQNRQTKENPSQQFLYLLIVNALLVTNCFLPFAQSFLQLQPHLHNMRVSLL